MTIVFVTFSHCQGGHIAVCDFTVTEAQWSGMSNLWKWIFAHDHVHLRAEHIPTLAVAFEQRSLEVGFGQFQRSRARRAMEEAGSDASLSGIPAVVRRAAALSDCLRARLCGSAGL